LLESNKLQSSIKACSRLFGARFFIGIIAVNSSFSIAKENNFDIMKKKWELVRIIEKKAFLLNITLAFQMFTFYYYRS